MLRKTLISTFDDRRDAERALRRLTAAGFAPSELRLRTSDLVDEEDTSVLGASDPASVEGANRGAAWGSFLGALAFSWIAVSTMATDAIGLIAVVPVVAAALGAGAGGAAGTVLGALVSSGVSDPQAHAAEEAVRRGKVVLTVPAELGSIQRARAILFGAGGVGVQSRAAPRAGHAHHA